MLRSLVLGSVAFSSVLAPGAVAFTGNYTGGTPNFCLPSIDSLDWGDCYNFDFTVAQATMSQIVANQTSAAASTTTIAASLTAETARASAAEGVLTTAVNSTGAAVTNEIARAQAAEAVLSASTSSVLGVVNSTAAALTIETNTRQTFQTLTAANTTTIYAAVNSTGSALTIEANRAVAAEAGKLGATAAAGGSLSGNYPNPGIAAGVIGASQLAASLGISSGCAAGYYLSTMTVVNGIVTGGGCVLAGTGSGSGGSLISTGTLTASATSFPLRNQLMFDSTFVTLTDSPTINATFASFKNMGGITSAPTRTVLTSVSTGTYTVPAGVSMLRIRMVGGGGGGGAQATNSGTVGGATSIAYVNVSSITANPGIGGGPGGGGGSAGAVGGAGGSNGAGSASFRLQGGGGCGANYSACGGSSAFGGGAPGAGDASAPGLNASANTGGGGGGASGYSGGVGIGGAGGGSGEYVEVIINSPPATIAWTVGNGGNGGAAGTNAGGNGGSGVIIIDEYYGTQGFAAPASTQVYPNGTIGSGQTTFTNCVANSTATWTATANRAQVCFSGSASAAAHTQLSLLLDGGYFPGFTSTLGMTGDTNGSGNASFCVMTPVLTAGTHNVCLTAESNGGVITIPGSSTLNGIATLSVYELKNAIGTGDVSSNGTNTLSGALTVSGSLAVTSLDEQWEQNSAANGSTGVRCKVFSNVVISSGTGITYTSDSVNGDKWTINKAGLYSIHIHGVATAGDAFGVSQNNQSCTTVIGSVPDSQLLCYAAGPSNIADCAFTGWLMPGNILHFHQGGATGVAGDSAIQITRIY